MTNPKCPHCGAIDDEWDYWLDQSDNNDSYDAECGECMKSYNVKLTFTTTKIDWPNEDD